jgi:hypothetical protein
MGPLQLFPTLTLRDIGIDSNVYNESQVRREDFTYTVSPTLKTLLPIGEARLTTRGALDFRYFQSLKDQQSTSGALNAQLEVGSGRVRPFGTAGLVRSHDRGGYDVDRRAFSMASQAKIGASLALTPVTSSPAGSCARPRDSIAARSRRRLPQRAAGSRHTRLGHRPALRPHAVHVGHVRDRGREDPVRPLTVARRQQLPLRAGAAVHQGRHHRGAGIGGFRDFRPVDARLAPYRGFVASVTMGSR